MKKKDQDIKVVIMNPENIPVAAERLIENLYEEYMRIVEENNKTLN